jgi:hypothetical protein
LGNCIWSLLDIRIDEAAYPSACQPELTRIKEKDMLIATLIPLHVVISLIGLVAGFIVLIGLIASRRLTRWTPIFLWTTLATNLTGFLFPVHKLLPSHVVGILSVVTLGLAFLAQYRFQLSGIWQRVFVIASTVALYLNTFVAIVQCFKHIPAFQALAPTQSEPPFLVMQLIFLLLFIVLGVTATRRFRPIPIAP